MAVPDSVQVSQKGSNSPLGYMDAILHNWKHKVHSLKYLLQGFRLSVASLYYVLLALELSQEICNDNKLKNKISDPRSILRYEI